VFYCTAAPGEELNGLLTQLAAREGLAIVSLEDSVREAVPPAARPAVLTPSEIKGLDFHTICVLNGGRHLEQIVRSSNEHRFVGSDIEGIRRRLAIDELRVALSRPAERLIWLDVAPAPKTVRTVLDFLNHDESNSISPSIPAAVMTALDEEQLDLEERVQRCQADARQYLAVRPEIAWSRAQQAVGLLGDPENVTAVQDESVRQGARLTLAEICFCLAFRNVHLAAELGRPDLFQEAWRAAFDARRPGLATMIRCIGQIVRADANGRRMALASFAENVVHYRDQMESWVLAEIQGSIGSWVAELESVLAIGENAVSLAAMLPTLYDALRLPDAATRKQRLIDRVISSLMKTRRHSEALRILETLPERRPDLEAQCLEAKGDYVRAAETYRSLGQLKEALNCYRAIPDFETAAALIRQVGAHPAAEAYEWLEKLRKLVAERPQNFNRVMQPSEKKILEGMLEQALGVARKKPAASKAGAKTTAKRAATKRAAPARNKR